MVQEFPLKYSSDRKSMEDWLGYLLTCKYEQELSGHLVQDLREFSRFFSWDQYFVLRFRYFPFCDEGFLRVPSIEMFHGFRMKYQKLTSLVQKVALFDNASMVNQWNLQNIDLSSDHDVLVIGPEVFVSNLILRDSYH